MHEIYITEFGYQNKDRSAYLLVESLKAKHGDDAINECNNTSLNLQNSRQSPRGGQVTSVARKFESNIARNQARSEKTNVRAADVDSFVRSAVQERGVEANSDVSFPHRRQTEALDSGVSIARLRNEIMVENWLSFIDVSKVRNNQNDPTIAAILKGESKPFAQWTLIRCCLKDEGRAFLESSINLRSGNSGSKPTGFFVAGLYGSGKSESVNQLRKDLGQEFPNQINADIVKVYLKKQIGGLQEFIHDCKFNLEILKCSII